MEGSFWFSRDTRKIRFSARIDHRRIRIGIVSPTLNSLFSSHSRLSLAGHWADPDHCYCLYASSVTDYRESGRPFWRSTYNRHQSNHPGGWVSWLPLCAYDSLLVCDGLASNGGYQNVLRGQCITRRRNSLSS